MTCVHRTARAVCTVVCLLMAALVLLAAGKSHAAALSEDAVPEPLKPWVDWALFGYETSRCPFAYGSFDDKRCFWPGVLEVRVDDAGASFTQDWHVYADGFIPLPGDESLWPQDVRLNGLSATVTASDGRPRIRAGAGTHTVSGRLPFERPPEFLQIPGETGLVSLVVAGREVAAPDLDTSGRLWLSADAARRDDAPQVRNTLELRVFRRVADEVPVKVETRIELDVSGEPREVLLGPVMTRGAIPMSLDSALPARLEADGRLRVQVRAGVHELALVARQAERVTELERMAASAPWPETEVWVFDARPPLRLVQIEGVPTVDPRQTSLPPQWQDFPAYRVTLADTFRMVVKRRGNPEPDADRLHLNRTLWLDFDGSGYTVNDHISGQLSAGWRLEAEPVLDLGRVSVDGEPWFITRREGVEREGVELRRGDLDLSADARIERRGALPALGWHHDFQSARARVHLPPGWRLFSASGVDRVDHTWLSRWTLFDLFLLLIVAAVAGRLWGWPWGLVALLGVGLVFHESGAPRQVWLHIFAATALLSVLPRGAFARWVSVYRYVALAALVVILIPFAVDQVRVALFPQLERPWQSQPAAAPGRGVAGFEAKQRARPAAEPALKSEVLEDRASELNLAQEALRTLAPSYESDALSQIDPKANIQTGPGLPRWQWRQAELIWNGPLSRGQPLHLVLLSPGVNLALRLLSVVLLGLLAVRVLTLSGGQRFPFPRSAGGAAAVALIAGAVLGGAPEDVRATAVTGVVVADGVPEPEILRELRNRLLQAPDCVPGCASIPRMRLDAAENSLVARLEVHAQAQLALPLPGRHGAWLADRVQVDGIDAGGVHRDASGTVWVVLEPGIHQLVLSGRLPRRDRVEIALPLPPRRVEAVADGWEVDGIRENGAVGGQIQLRRTRAAESAPQALQPGALPPFVQVERTLLLGLEWRVHTRVRRVSPPGSAVVFEVPLMRGEAVTTDDVTIVDDRVQVSLAANAVETGWQSVLAQRPDIELVAPQTTTWTEIWHLNASPIWHVEYAGIPVIHQQQGGRRFPTWRPWPGERVSLAISRPEGVEGNTLTIDVSELSLSPGLRATDATLSFEVRSSQGTQHPVVLPEGADLQAVFVDERSQPIRAENGTVTLPLSPGAHTVKLSWRMDGGIAALFATPEVHLGAPGVNASTRVNVPQSRWVLFAGGPSLGPAVMFWGLLIVIVAVAVGLGRTGRTPLKTPHWLLLGVGLSQIPIYFSILVVGWLFALDARSRLETDLRKWQFNLMQAGLVLLTLIALGVLFFAVKQGLLGLPDMQIGGNGSRGHVLRWFEDRTGDVPANAWVLSVPLTVYRLLMLAWALWIAFALIGWLRYSWEAFSKGGYWRAIVLGRPKRAAKPEAPAPADESKPQ